MILPSLEFRGISAKKWLALASYVFRSDVLGWDIFKAA